MKVWILNFLELEILHFKKPLHLELMLISKESLLIKHIIMKKIKYILTLTALIVAFASCSDNELIEKPPHFIAADNLYVDLAGFETGLNGLYKRSRD